MGEQETQHDLPRRNLLHGLGLGGLGVAALAAAGAASPESAAAGDAAGIVGVWRIQVSRSTGPTFPIYDIYLRDGLMFTITSLRAREDIGVGVWDQVGENRYRNYIERFVHEEDGRVHRHVIESESTVTGDTMQIRAGSVTVHDLDGNVVQAFTGDLTGTRLRPRR